MAWDPEDIESDRSPAVDRAEVCGVEEEVGEAGGGLEADSCGVGSLGTGKGCWLFNCDEVELGPFGAMASCPGSIIGL